MECLEYLLPKYFIVIPYGKIYIRTCKTLTEWGSLTGHTILVLDDLMMEAADSSEIVHLLCVGSRHHQITVIHILHNVFHQGKSMRSALVNAHYFILMNNKRDKNQILTLGKQIFPGKTKYFMDSFEKKYFS